MALSVSAAFKAAQSADVVQLAQKVMLVLGDYANSNGYSAVASSSGDDGSGNYPAAGAIDGDRTEINVGAAASADNGVGKSSWMSSGIPDSGASVWWMVDLGQARTINRVKLYHRNGHGIKTYFIEYSADGTNWYSLAATSDYTGGGTGYGEGGFGDGPFGGGGGSAPSPTVVTTTMQLDTIDTAADVSARYLRLTAVHTQVASEAAQIVAFEVYRKVDVTDRCLSLKVDRQRDYKLLNPLAATTELVFDNSDRFFSISHVPTASEVAAGFVNSELRPGMGLIVQTGFYTVNGKELVNSFVGTCDGVRISSKDRRATITGRDGIKGLINQVVSTKLKTSQDIGTNVQYLLNLANVSNYEMSVDSTTIILDYFFSYETSILTVLQQLVLASGDAQIYFDENGTAQFKMYMNSVPQSHTDTNQADFEAGTVLRNLDTFSAPGSLSGKYVQTGNWTIQTTPSTQAASDASGGSLQLPSNRTGAGQWQTTIALGSGDAKWFFIWQSFFDTGATNADRYGFALHVNSTTTWITREDKNSSTTLLSVSRTPNASDVYKVTRDGANLFTLYINGVSQGTFTDTAYTGTSFVLCKPTGACTYSAMTVSDIGGANSIDPLAVDFQSQVIDQTASVNSEGTFSANVSLPTGSSISWYTATSADGVTFDAWVAATPGSPIASTARRYIKYRALFNIPSSAGGGSTPIVYDDTIAWYTGTGSQKNHASVDFFLRYDSSLTNIEQELADNLGGDTAIINDVAVKSAPLVLSGTSSDTQWQGTTGTPAAAISAGNPLAVVAGTLVINADIQNGMDTSGMAGGSALVCTAGTAVIASATITTVHPTKPVITIVISSGGTITDLRLVGKAFSSSQTPFQSVLTSAQSVALYNRRTQQVNNNFIISQAVASAIATRLILNYANPTSYVPTLEMQPTFSMQLGDRVNIVDQNTDLSADYTVVGLEHTMDANESGASAQTSTVLVKIS